MEELGFESSASVPNALLTMFGLPPWSTQNSEEFQAMSNLTSVEINHQRERDFGNNSVEFRREEELTYDNVSLDNNNKFFYLLPHEFETMKFHSTSNLITTAHDNAETAAMKLASYSCLLNRPSAGLQDHDHQNILDSQIQASIDSINCLVSLTNTVVPDAAAMNGELRRIDVAPPIQDFCREKSVMSNQMNNWNVDYSGSGDYGGNRISSGVSSDSAAEHDEAVSNYPPNSHDDHKISIKRKFSESIICNFKNTNGASDHHHHHAENNNYLSFDAYLSDYSPKGGGGFRLITESTTTCNKQQKRPAKSEKPQRSSSNINFLNPNSPSFLEQDTEAIASMKEMIYRAAVMRPINLGTEVISEKPKRKNVRISSDPQTVAARHRRERISDRIRVLQRLVPGGSKMDTASMLDEAANYLKFLKSQVSALESLGNNSMQINNMNNHHSMNYNQQYYCPPPPPPPFTINIP